MIAHTEWSRPPAGLLRWLSSGGCGRSRAARCANLHWNVRSPAPASELHQEVLPALASAGGGRAGRPPMDHHRSVWPFHWPLGCAPLRGYCPSRVQWQLPAPFVAKWSSTGRWQSLLSPGSSPWQWPGSWWRARLQSPGSSGCRCWWPYSQSHRSRSGQSPLQRLLKCRRLQT